MPMGHPARGVQEAIRREVRAGDGSDVLLQSAVDKHFRVSRARDVIWTFPQGPDFNPEFLMTASQSHIQLPSAGPCSKVSVAGTTPLEMNTWPVDRGSDLLITCW